MNGLRCIMSIFNVKYSTSIRLTRWSCIKLGISTSSTSSKCLIDAICRSHVNFKLVGLVQSVERFSSVKLHQAQSFMDPFNILSIAFFSLRRARSAKSVFLRYSKNWRYSWPLLRIILIFFFLIIARKAGYAFTTA